jgi:PhnB protein
MAAVAYKPEGYHAVTPYLAVRDAVAAVAFYRRAFGAELLMKLTLPDGKYAHAEIRIGDCHVMMAEENPEWGNSSPQTLGGSPVSFLVYMPDVDAAHARAPAAGRTQARPVENQFYGDCTGTLKDPFGFRWSLGTHNEDVSEAEGQRRMEAMFGG